MSEEQNEYTIVMKKSGKIIDDFWAIPATQHLRAKERGWDLRKVNIVKIYPREN